MAGQFKKGDVVVLRSGGPAMTVTGQGQGGYDNSVTWFDDNDIQHFSEFDDDVLEEVEMEDDEE